MITLLSLPPSIAFSLSTIYVDVLTSLAQLKKKYPSGRSQEKLNAYSEHCRLKLYRCPAKSAKSAKINLVPARVYRRIFRLFYHFFERYKTERITNIIVSVILQVERRRLNILIELFQSGFKVKTNVSFKKNITKNLWKQKSVH